METLMRLEREALDYFEHERIGPERVVTQRFADMRYLGQEHTVRVPLPGGELGGDSMREIEERFGSLHEQHYTFRLDTSPVEFVNFHLTAFGTVEKPGLRRLEPDGRRGQQARKGEREVDFDELGRHRSAVYERALLGAGAQVDGPAVVEEPAASTVLLPGDRLTVDDYGSLVIEVEI
jgi:N-methylhydantoinase A